MIGTDPRSWLSWQRSAFVLRVKAGHREALREVLRDRRFAPDWEPVVAHASTLSPGSRAAARAGRALGLRYIRPRQVEGPTPEGYILLDLALRPISLVVSTRLPSYPKANAVKKLVFLVGPRRFAFTELDTRPVSGLGRGVFENAFERRAEVLELRLRMDLRSGSARRAAPVGCPYTRNRKRVPRSVGSSVTRPPKGGPSILRSPSTRSGSYSATSTSPWIFFPPGARWTSGIRDPTRSGPSVSGTAETVFVCQVASLVASVTYANTSAGERVADKPEAAAVPQAPNPRARIWAGGVAYRSARRRLFLLARSSRSLPTWPARAAPWTPTSPTCAPRSFRRRTGHHGPGATATEGPAAVPIAEALDWARDQAYSDARCRPGPHVPRTERLNNWLLLPRRTSHPPGTRDPVLDFSFESRIGQRSSVVAMPPGRQTRSHGRLSAARDPEPFAEGRAPQRTLMASAAALGSNVMYGYDLAQDGSRGPDLR
jgi:hypothetical protein